MHQIMMAAYHDKIVPLIREYDTRKKKLAINSSREMRRLLERYTSMIEVEIETAMLAIEELWQPIVIADVVRQFTETMSEIQRRILLTEILEQTGVLPDLYNLNEGVEQIVYEYEKNNLDFLPETIAPEYGSRVRDRIMDAVRVGAGLIAIGALVNECYQIAQRRAENIAVDQTYEMYQVLCEVRQTNLGIDSFVWLTMEDNAVRPSHARLHGRVFSWAEGAKGAGKDGQDIWPGGHAPDEGDWGCRCINMPYIED